MLFAYGSGSPEPSAAAALPVVASPTYKATYTGPLKLFLDQSAPATSPVWWRSR